MRFLRMFIVLALLAGGGVMAQNLPTIDLGDIVEGELTASESEVEYRFAGEQGQYVTITMERMDSIDPYLRLEDGDGRVLAEDDDSAGSLNSRIGPFQLPANGTYTIVATSLGGNDIGAFILSLETTVIQRLEYGQRVTGELSSASPEQTYLFTAEAGDVISIDMESSDFDAYLELYATNPRTQVGYNDDGGTDRNARLGPFVIPGSGDYQIVARAFSEADGEFTLSLNSVEPSPLTFAEAQEVQLSGGQPRYFSFEGRAGQVIDALADTGNTFDTSLILLGPDSNEITRTYDSGIDPVLTNVMLTQDGTHFLVVEPAINRDVLAPVTVKITESRVPSLDSGTQTVTFGDETSEFLLAFTGVADERVVLKFAISAPESISPNVDVMQGGMSLASISSYTISDEISFGLVVPTDGPVLVRLMNYSWNEAEITITLEREQSTT